MLLMEDLIGSLLVPDLLVICPAIFLGFDFDLWFFLVPPPGVLAFQSAGISRTAAPPGVLAFQLVGMPSTAAPPGVLAFQSIGTSWTN